MAALSCAVRLYGFNCAAVLCGVAVRLHGVAMRLYFVVV
jgi:hypothetical protein